MEQTWLDPICSASSLDLGSARFLYPAMSFKNTPMSSFIFSDIANFHFIDGLFVSILADKFDTFEEKPSNSIESGRLLGMNVSIFADCRRLLAL